MPLVKSGKITSDAFVHVADDDPLPEGGAILVSAARFLADAEALSRRGGGTGVIWPNNRDVDDLVPYLERLAVVALGGASPIASRCRRDGSFQASLTSV